MEYSWAQSEYARLPTMSDDLIRVRVSVIAAAGTPAALAAQAATSQRVSGQPCKPSVAGLHQWTTGYSRCAHPIDGKPALQAQFAYATHPWVAAPIAPMSADTAMITAQTVCRRVSKMYLTSIGLPSQ